jgi:hypothetical protein
VLIVAFGPTAREARAWWRIIRRSSVGREANLEGVACGGGGGGVALDFLDGGRVFAMLSTTR